jgi:hypothetical protein
VPDRKLRYRDRKARGSLKQQREERKKMIRFL